MRISLFNRMFLIGFRKKADYFFELIVKCSTLMLNNQIIYIKNSAYRVLHSNMCILTFAKTRIR